MTTKRTAEMICAVYEYVQAEHARSLVRKRRTGDDEAQGRCDVARLVESMMNDYEDVLLAAGAENRISELVAAEERNWLTLAA